MTASGSHDRQLEPLAPHAVQYGRELGCGVEIVAELTGHLFGRCQFAQLFRSGRVAGDFPLDSLQTVSELPQGVSQRFCFVFGAVGLFA